MAKMQSVLLFIFAINFASVNANEENDNWPCYLKKCERKAKNFNSCLFYHANIGLGHIIKGDDDAGIPKFVPLPLDNFSIGQNQTFKMFLNHVVVYGLNYLDVYDIKWDLDKKKIFIEFHFSNTLRISALYSAAGQFDGRDLTTDKGVLDFVYGDGSLTYTMNYKTKVYNGMNYATIDQCKATRKNAYIRYRLHNPNVDGNANNELPDSEAKKMDKALDDDINELICYVINLVFRPLFYNFPIDLMFD